MQQSTSPHPENRKPRTLEEAILLLQEKAKFAPISIGEILHILSGKGRPLILILLSLPFCQPIQIPGFSTPFGLVIAFVGLRIAFGKYMWLPKKLLLKKVEPEVIAKITDKTLNLLNKMKKWVHPRLNYLNNSAVMEIVNGLLIFVLGIFLALPLPIPLSNLAAAWSILLISLGMLEDDGVFVLAGYLVALLTVVFFAIIAFSAVKLF